MKFGELRKSTFEGITHVEDLAVDQFIDALRNFEDYEISEKVDGANIQFGIDDYGFYTTREDKGGQRVYNADDYPINFSTTFQRSAHLALEQKASVMREAGMRSGDRIEVEVLFGTLPNAVPYSSEENEIILLRVVEGDVDIAHLHKALDGDIVTVRVNAPYTVDGKTIKTAPETHRWSFSRTPTWDSESMIDDEIKDRIHAELDKLEAYLKQPSGVWKFSNAEVLALPLNRRPDSVEPQNWRSVKEQLKTKREEIQHEMIGGESKDGYKLRIKEILLNRLVRQIKSEFGPEVEDGGWIEGVVFRHKKTGDQFKVVDKDLFTTAKDFIWQVRNDLREKPRSVNTVESFLGKLLGSLSSAIGHPELGTTQAKRHLRKQGDSREEILDNLADGTNFPELQQYWVSVINQYETKLENLLSEYNDTKADLSIELDVGDSKRKFGYTDEVDKKTLQAFASLFGELENMKKGAKSADSTQDLIKLLVGRQLGEIS
jgi:hypothetical protein